MPASNQPSSSYQPLRILAMLTGLSLVMRFFSFFPSVMDHDESTYMVIADAVRHGQIYLRDVIDTKPIGIFTLFAIFQTLFGKSILVLRIITAIWVALTAWMLYLAHRELIKDSSDSKNPAPVASGVIYVFIISIFTFYGISPNTEHFFNLFTITALFLILRYQGLLWIYFAGFLLGLGFMIKYVVLFDALAIGLFYLWRQVMAHQKWMYWFSRCALMAFGFTIPFASIWMYYRQLGMEDTFMFYSFELSGRYIINPPWYDYVVYIMDGLLRFLPVTVWFIFCSWHWRTIGAGLPLLSWLWGSLVLFIILLPGKLFAHYFIQFMLPLSLLAGSFFDKRRSPGPALAWMRKPFIGYSILILIIVVNMGFQKADYFDKRDYPSAAAAYLNTRLQPGDILYTANAPQIIYLLTGTSSPTPYVHPSLIWDKDNRSALGIGRDEEWNEILKKKPRFIIIKNNLKPDNPMLPVLDTAYHQVQTFGRELVLFERN
ncbi:MAG: glycosyltransferase family 39 protein [Saprospiraceae bacterium]|nr:glycosyltransferase family 39 protein [Saprospiraceae bacterium]